MQPKPAPKKVSKAVSNTDRSVAQSRAKRSAAMNNRRGMTQESKPTAMQVEKEVSKQVKKTVVAKAKKQAQTKGSTKDITKVSSKGAARRERSEHARAVVTARKVNNGGRDKVVSNSALTRPPSKKVVTAAVIAMEQEGFSIPEGLQMVISFAPAPGAAVAQGSPQKKRNPRNAQPKAQAQADNGGQDNTNNNGRRRAPRGRGQGKN